MGRKGRAGYLMLGKGEKEMGISPDERRGAEALEWSDESWWTGLLEMAIFNNEILRGCRGQAKAGPALGCIMTMN